MRRLPLTSLGRFGVSVVAVAMGALPLPATTSDAFGGGPQPTRPMAISCDTVFAFTPTGSVHIEGLCQYTHLGRTTVVADQNVIPQPDGSLLITNLSVYTAANGDELYAAAVGTGNFTGPTSVAFTGVETYQGGTGRFAGATGSVPFSGGAEFDTLTTGTGHFAGSGVISY